MEHYHDVLPAVAKAQTKPRKTEYFEPVWREE